jgi:hypothetical protein
MRTINHIAFRPIFALLILAIAVGGCGGTRSSASIPTAAQERARPANSSQNILLYAGGNKISYVLSLAGTLVGTIDRPSYGTCSDSSGNVYMTGVGSVAEFAYGQTTPFATASVPGTAYSCSVDPTTGDVAVVLFCATGCGDEIAVFTNLNYPPQLYQTSALTQMLFCGYDASGDLFVDGYNKAHFALAELPAGASTFSPIAVDQAINDPGQVQWDGHYMTVEDAYLPVIYQFSISGSAATTVGAVHFWPVGRRAAESWIAHGLLAVPTGRHGKRAVEIGIWFYPSGGKRAILLKGFVANHRLITGVTIAVLPNEERRRI